tara:strand:- start:42 stop:1235 length:1194 start_codon:yes stop_codon:yes gene_type:complete
MPEEELKSVTLDSLIVGEVSEDVLVEIKESITRFSCELTADRVSSISFSVYDPGFKMHDRNYFLVQRTVAFNNMLYEIADVTCDHKQQDSIQVVCRNKAMERMRRAKGQHSWGSISPTDLASLLAKQYGLSFFGEPSPIQGAITRKQDKNTDESSYQVLQRLARDLEFRFFEAKGTLFFASEPYIVGAQGQIQMTIPGREAVTLADGSYSTDTVFTLSCSLKRSQDSKKPATFNATIYKNPTTEQLYPGLGASVFKIKEQTVVDPDTFETTVEKTRIPFPNYSDLFFIDKVSYGIGPSQQVTISGTSILESPDMVCTLETFRSGSEGVCVERIQQAVGVDSTAITGVFDSNTVSKVKTFQTANSLASDGIVGPATWEKIQDQGLAAVSAPVTEIRAS